MDDTYGGMSLLGDDDETDDSYVGLSDEDDDETDDSYVGLSDGTEEDDTEQDDTEQDGTDQDHEMDGVVALYTPEQHEDIEMHENLEHGYEGTEVRVEEEAGGAEVEAARAGVAAARGGVEATTAVEEEWDDGLDLVKGQEFRTKVAMQVLVQRGAHKNGFEYETLKSDTVRFVAKCRGAKEGCKWYLRVVKLKNSDLWTVRTYNKSHTCSVVTTSTLRNRRRGTPHVVASVLSEEYPGRYDTPTPADLISMVTHKVGVDVSYATAWRGKRMAANEVRVDAAKIFKYLFFAFGASIEGFAAMRKVIIVDGTHLKHVYGGVLLVATAQDPDRHHYPIAFGVVDGEKDESWMWFMNKLRSVIADEGELVFLSDRNASLIKSIREVFPMAAHGYCIWHLSQNVKGHVFNNRDACASKFTECAHAYTVAEFDDLYDAFSRRYPSAAAYLEKSVEVRKWARCYFEGDRYNVNTTNAAESINGVLREARKFFMLPMIDVIIKKMTEWFNKHRKKAAEIPVTKKLVPTVEKKLSKRCLEARCLDVVEINSFHLEYNVNGSDGKIYTVDLARKMCTCRCFDLDKIPCVHAAAAAKFLSVGRDLHLQEFCSKYYLVELWALAYCRTIYPVPHMSEWVIPDEIRALKVLPRYTKKRKDPLKSKGFHQPENLVDEEEDAEGEEAGAGEGEADVCMSILNVEVLLPPLSNMELLY
ncbi:protein FAR1-RELATED SEQUENCE 5-like [Brassica rapa]|uniref:protein FAR1-RELATED SEQUENCE 5-like n=1 Tax=Brassica campestris TaxID=3711 RepID=UPI00142E6559|nr:protein FAR1-RELATED SEQUENCE 5-like [Brassica rapa]